MAHTSDSLIARLVAQYQIQLDRGREEARHWLELLSNRQLAENIARTRRHLATVRDEQPHSSIGEIVERVP